MHDSTSLIDHYSKVMFLNFRSIQPSAGPGSGFDPPVGIDNDPVHAAVRWKVVGDGKVLRRSIISQCYRSFSPAKANLQIRRFNMAEQILQESVAFDF